MPSRPYNATGGLESGAVGAAAYDRICELAITRGAAMLRGADARVARRIARLVNMIVVFN